MAGKFNIAFNSTVRILAQQIETQALFSIGKLIFCMDKFGKNSRLQK
jgi:hypothetical protein